MRNSGMRSFMERRLPSSFKIQITSMVDMFVIILVFLIKSYSTSPINVAPTKDMTLPISTVESDPVDVVKLMVSKSGIFLEQKKVMDLENGTPMKQDLDSNDPLFLSALFKELDGKAKLAKDISKVNDTLEFDGKILMQADKDLPYSLLQKVMYTSMLAGYSDVKLAVVAKDF